MIIDYEKPSENVKSKFVNYALFIKTFSQSPSFMHTGEAKSYDQWNNGKHAAYGPILSVYQSSQLPPNQ